MTEQQHSGARLAERWNRGHSSPLARPALSLRDAV